MDGQILSMKFATYHHEHPPRGEERKREEYPGTYFSEGRKKMREPAFSVKSRFPNPPAKTPIG